MAHELVDAEDGQRLYTMEGGLPLRRYEWGNVDAGERSAEAMTVARGLRRLFSAIRNARALGDCGVFEDSDGVSGWGTGWFLSRYSYVQGIIRTT